MNLSEIQSLEAENDAHTCMRCYKSLIGLSSYINHKQKLCPARKTTTPTENASPTLKNEEPEQGGNDNIAQELPVLDLTTTPTENATSTLKNEEHEQDGNDNIAQELPKSLDLPLDEESQEEFTINGAEISENIPEIHNNCESGELDSEPFSLGNIQETDNTNNAIVETKSKHLEKLSSPSNLPKYNILGFNCHTSGFAYVLGEDGTLKTVTKSPKERLLFKQVKKLSKSVVLKIFRNSKKNLAHLCCQQCEAKFKRKQKYAKHLKNKHGLAAYACTLCNFKFQKFPLLKEHLLLHKIGRQCNQANPIKVETGHSFSAPDLPFKLMHPVIRLKKLEINTNDTVIVSLRKRKHSPERFDNRQELDHSIDAGYDPIEEKENFNKPKKMKISSSLNQSPNTEKTCQESIKLPKKSKWGTACMLCTLCTVTFPSESMLADHIAHVHSRIDKSSQGGGIRSGDSFCHTCGMPLEGAEALQAHLPSELHRAMVKEVVGNQPWPGRAIRYSEMALKKVSARGGRYQCPLCPAKIVGKKGVRLHLRTHSAVRPFQCNLCSFSCGKSEELHVHLKRHHVGLKDHCCLHCGFSTFSMNSLKHHIQQQHGKEETTYQCQICQSYHHQENAFWEHMKIHPKQQSYFKCTFKRCQKVLQSKDKLMNHIKKHTAMKPFQCNKCNFIASNKRGMERHALTHTGTDLKCGHKGCNFSTKFEYNLQRHTNRLHPEEKQQRGYKCPHCAYCYHYYGGLIRHIKDSKKHPGLALYVCPYCPATAPKFQTNFPKEYSTHLTKAHQDENIDILSVVSMVTKP